MCFIVCQDFDSFLCTYWHCNLNKQAHKANTYLLGQRLGSAELQEFNLNEKAIYFMADIREFERDGAKSGVFSPKRWQGQRHDGSACDGVAVSCDERRKTS